MTKTPNSLTEKLDKVLTHKIWGMIIFILFMWLMFTATFKLGNYPALWINMFFNYISTLIGDVLTPGIVEDFIIEGLLHGIGGIVMFVPSILILFVFISLVETTGYIYRVEMLFDKAMTKIGLHGRAFIPLLIGFGCNVPAIMAIRNLEHKNDRLITMLIAPFMSCSARLPVYVLFIGAFFPDYSGTVLFAIYATGVLMAILVSIILRHTIFKGVRLKSVAILHPYKLPKINILFNVVWINIKHYIKKIGTVIVVASIIIWVLEYFPRKVNYSKDYNKEMELVNIKYDAMIDAQTLTINKLDSIKTLKQTEINNIKFKQLSEQKENSYIGRIGKFIEPVLSPLGFDWKLGICILSGISSKEVTISTFNIIFQSGHSGESSSATLINNIKSQTYLSGDKIGQKVFTPAVALSFMVFILLYFPCIGVISAIKNVSGKWKWAIFTVLYTTATAWIVSFIVYQVSSIIL